MKIKFGRRDEIWEDEYWDIPTSDYDVIKESMKDSWDYINTRVKEMNFDSYYTKCNFDPENNWIEVDFGSHSWFFLISDLKEKDWKDFIG